MSIAGDLTDEEYAIPKSLISGMAALMPDISKYILSLCPSSQLVARYRSRARPYEEDLDLSYAQEQDRLYREWYQSLPRDCVLYIHEKAGVSLKQVIRFILS